MVKEILLKSTNTPIRVINEVGILKTKQKYFFFSKYKGFDYETEILDFDKKYLIAPMMKMVNELDNVLVDNHMFFRNIAPRNIIYSKNTNYIIDFDGLLPLSIENKNKIFLKNLIRYVWFADIVDLNKLHNLFHNFQYDNIESIVDPIDFEKLYFQDLSKIRISDILNLYEITTLFERKAIFEGKEVYGQQLSRFLSDYVTLEDEVNLYKYLTNNKSGVNLTRGLLFFASRIDQELMLRQKYTIDCNKQFLTKSTINRLLSGKDIKYSNIDFSNKELPFERRYQSLQQALQY